MAKQPNPIDVHVGSRVRLRRMLLSISQEKLGEQMGLTFQQIQKYEKGTNRIGASRLYRISQILDVPVQFFFEDAPVAPGQEGGKASGLSERQNDDFLYEFISTRDGLELIRAFVSIRDPKVRKRVVDLVRTLADEDHENQNDKKSRRSKK